MADKSNKTVFLGGGTNQTGARAYNERLVLSLIRRHQRLAKAELARGTGLSAQTLTLIVNRLEAEGLVQKTEPMRGKVGQPSIPYSLAPDAAYSFGVKIGRRSAEIVLCNFLGEIVTRSREAYRYPTPKLIIDYIEQHTQEMANSLPKLQRNRIIGVGVAMPFEIWNWREKIHAPKGALEQWQNVEIETAVENVTQLPVIVVNDATAACAAEVSRANDDQHLNLAYLYLGWFIGGGIVLNGTLYPGPTGNAGAFGTMPVFSTKGPVQLLTQASLYSLEEMLISDGHDPAIIISPSSDWSEAGDTVTKWISQISDPIALAILATISVIDFESVIIDGAVPDTVRQKMVQSVKKSFEKLERQALSDVNIIEGCVGFDARAIGAAMVPILANFTRDREVLFKNTDLG